ncbi:MULTISPECIES: entericidin A/B family lipoprotein [Cupriavidus]|uniref:Entericidin A/B family lipoprotein n=1 Tax=Cupriavidus pauculus TaxID=82633 RepID=A0A3G8HAV2_9BURK|nr:MULTISPECIES: entericidin A/B family lipoprotein [Cupriavidus]AZG16722.1 entericidin A/B family lipoprotein [Cupriavidus pauculus]MDT6961318.1 entericidin A/B family lipoprotein [Cupriavidus sp. SZY C1]
MKKGWIWCVLVASLLAGCNTMSGLGQDVQKGGQKLENTAEKSK